jgi:hypothetical protein
MKNFIAFFVIVTCISVTVYAQNFSLDGQTIIRSKYVGPDGLQFYENPVIQSNITLKHKSGLFFDLWHSTGFNSDWSTDWDDEIDYTIGWKGKISPLSLNVLLSYFDNFKNWDFTYNDVIKGNINLGYPKQIYHWLKISPFIDYTTFIIPNKSTPFGGGNLYSFGFDNEINITEKIKVTPLIKFIWDDGAFDVKAGSLIKLSSSLKLTLSEHITANVIEVAYYSLFKKREMKNEFVIGTGISWNL